MGRHSTKSAKPSKPSKPNPAFPLTANGNGQWSKKIRGRVFYFGTWDDPSAALQRWLAEKDYLLAGRTPPQCNTESPTVSDLVNSFLAMKRNRKQAGELSEWTYRDYVEVSEKMIAQFGDNTLMEDLTPADFENFRARLQETNGAVRLMNLVNRTKAILRWGHRQKPQLCPIDDLADFSPPPKGERRLEKSEKRKKLIERTELHRLLTLAEPTLRAAILLGVNAGFGNSDISRLEFGDIDLDTGWLSHLRKKTAIPRRAKLWPETIAAIRAVIETRPTPADEKLSRRVFLRPTGREIVRRGGGSDWIGRQFSAAAKLANVVGAFYDLRHVFRTQAGECRDIEAVRIVMGHAQRGIDEHYIEGVSNARLEAIAETVHKWLYPSSK